MYENNPAYQEYPEVTPDANTIEEPTDHKKAVATAVGGSVVLGAAAYGLSLLDDGSSEAPVSDDSSAVAAAAAADARAKASLPVLPVVMPVESELSKLDWPLDRLDELTFDEAFAAARHQMGPAHHFNWHSGTYNTFYQQEEANLTKAERDAFIATLPTDKESASANEPEAPARAVHPSGGVRHQTPAVAEPQLADADAEHRTVAVVPAITVVPLAAVADHEVTPLADAHSSDDANFPEPMIADHHGANALHGEGIAGSTIDSIDHHDQFDHNHAQDEYGMDQHHLGE
ncbi:hypothetical protein [uncultured Fibrella sp.]|uniref:hypothetical protein n=1 Tax=uncultured Fibrella sp. TaxID=1284596 RepID=UPI0035CBC36B